MAYRFGSRVPAHATAVGQALLAHLPDAAEAVTTADEIAARLARPGEREHYGCAGRPKCL
ncbi:MAG TPA: IclR family transcriptional regulator C-terminal domain-containing protein [Actinomycetes bacterium]|nr:IclR family transcriptional regulator C-terminal domain-containing protein [Actinomycetes bacterium]